jgi:hypothetical protein
MSLQRIQKLLDELPQKETVYIDIPRYELFVERVDKNTWQFLMGIPKDICPIDMEDMDDDPFYFQLPKHPVHHHLCEPVVAHSRESAIEYLNSYINQRTCDECHNHYTGFSLHPSICARCFFAIPSIEMTDKCPICLREKEEMQWECVVKCEQCKTLVCYGCFKKMSPTHDKEKFSCQKKCPMCRESNKLNQKFIVET